MTALIQWFEADGETPASRVDWGYIGPGQTAPDRTYIYRNTGDTPATTAALTVMPVGASDLEGWITGTHDGQSFTATTPLDIGSVPAGAEGSVTLSLAVPAGALLSSRPVMAQVGLTFDLEG